MPSACHFIVEGNPALIYSTRGGQPQKILPTLGRFLEKFWRERETFGAYVDTPECLVAQIAIRFGYETAEDDFSNLRIGVNYNPAAEYLYWIGQDHAVQVWVPDEAYRHEPSLGLKGCHLWEA